MTAEPAANESGEPMEADAARLLMQGAKEVLDRAEAERSPGLSLRAVRWGRTVPTGNYSNARLDAEAVVYAGDAEEVLLELKSWVGQHLPPSEQDLDAMAMERRNLNQQIDTLNNRLHAAQYQFNKVKALFERMGISMPEEYTEDLPF